MVAKLSGATAAGVRVYANRVHNKQVNPCILIYDEQESATPRNIGAAQYIRKLTMKIECTVETNTNYDTVLDDLTKQVEDLIVADRSISGTATSSLYISTELKFEPSEKTVGQAILTYEITYIN